MNEILLINPRKRKKRRKTTAKRRRNPSPYRRKSVAKRRIRRRNPNGLGRANTLFMPALAGASGALALDIALAYIPVPLAMKTGIGGYAVKGISAIGLGMLMQNFKLVKHKTAVDMTVGALTVMLHGALKEQIGIMLPNVPLSAYLTGPGLNNWVGSGYPGGNIEDDPYGAGGMGAYLPDLSTEDIGIDSQNLGEYISDGYETGGGY